MLATFAVLLLLGSLAVGLLLSQERRFIYFPTRDYSATPDQYGLIFRDLDILSGVSVHLRGWWIEGGGQTALIYFHGNGGNVSHRLERAKLLAEALHLDVVLVDYRGYGQSSGLPSEAGLYADGAAIYGAVRERGFSPERIVLFGESLGCAVAIETALSHPVRSVILETPFLSIPAMAKTIYPFVPAFLVRTRFDNASKVGRLAMPKLIAVAEHDDVVAPQQGLKLYELAAAPKELYLIRGARHNDTYVVGGQGYLKVWRRFLERTGG